MSSPSRPTVKRTYGKSSTATPRINRLLPSSPRSSPPSSPSTYRVTPTPPLKRKRGASQNDLLSFFVESASIRSQKRPCLLDTSGSAKKKQKLDAKGPLTQLHLTTAKTSIRTCPLCQLSYTRGAPEDEALHKTHCLRVSRGSEWGKEEARAENSEVSVVREGVVLRGRERGRIVKFSGDISGKVGSKLSALLETINFSLSAPDLPDSVLAASKIYLFLLPTATSPLREKIVGCVVATRIDTAMRIVPATISSENLVKVTDDVENDAAGGLYCDPEGLATPCGIPRIFVSLQHRHKGIAHALLDAAASTFIHGCTLDPSKGEIAFSQPTGAGRGVMNKWGKGGVRIYQE